MVLFFFILSTDGVDRRRSEGFLARFFFEGRGVISPKRREKKRKEKGKERRREGKREM